MRRIKLVAPFLLLAAPAEAECRFQPFTFFFGSPATAALTCSGTGDFRWQPDLDDSSTLSSLKIIKAPRAGKLTTTGIGFVYSPKAGAKGADSFVVRISGKGPEGSGPSDVTVNVGLQ